MRAIVLAGGYAKRLWPLTKELAKPLVDLNGRPIISYILDALEKSKNISEIIISTNAKFENDFRQKILANRYSKPIKIVAEPTTSENQKLGAMGGIDFVLESQKITDGLLVMGGDNLLGIDIDAAIEEFRKNKAPWVGVYDVKDMERMKQLGEVTIDGSGKIIRMREKPENPETTLASTCCYIFPAGIREKIKEYLSGGNNKDAPGHFIAWLAGRTDVYAHVFDSYWFDIGDHETLEKAREFARKNLG